MSPQKFTFAIVVVILILFSFFFTTIPVKAETDIAQIITISTTLAQASPEEQTKIWNNLTQAERDAVTQFNTVVKVDSIEIDEENIDGPGCKSKKRTEIGTNGFGMELWTYWSRIYWCYNGLHGNGQMVTDARWTHGATIPLYSPWRWNGDIGPQEDGGEGEQSYYVWITGILEVEIGGYPIDVAYPWIAIEVFGDGHSVAGSGQG